jgi:SAM-dependent methyltransferase
MPSVEERIGKIGFRYQDQLLTEILPCNLCGANRWIIIAHSDRYGFPAQTTLCENCGLIILNPRMTSSSYSYFYKDIYRPLVSAYHGRKIDSQTIQDEQKLFAAEAVRFVSPFINRKNGENMLDVGGSTGVIAAHFAKEFNIKATVIDPAPDETAVARSMGIETVTALIENWQPIAHIYYIISMFQTADHLLDINAVLKKLRKIIREDGILIVDIVDFRAAYLRLWSIESAIKIDHPFSLTQEVMEAYLGRNGFRVSRKSFNSDHLHVSYICRPSPDIGKKYLPSKLWIKNLISEIMFIQNAPKGQVEKT